MEDFRWEQGKEENWVRFEFEDKSGHNRRTGVITWDAMAARPRYTGLGHVYNIFVYTQPCSPDSITPTAKAQFLRRIGTWVQQYFPKRYLGIDLSQARVCLPEVVHVTYDYKTGMRKQVGVQAPEQPKGSMFI